MPNTPNRLQIFAEYLKQEVRLKCEPESGTPRLLSEAFVVAVLERLMEHNEASDWTLCAYEDPARPSSKMSAAKLSAWSISGDGATLDLFASLYLNEESPTIVTRAEVERHFKLLRGFLKRALEGWHTKLEPSADAFGAMQRIHEARDALTTVRLFFLTDGLAKVSEVPEEQAEGLELRYVFWDLEKLSRLQVGDRQTINLDFAEDYGGEVPALEHVDATGEYRTYLAFVPASVLAKIYGTHGQRLLESNVRAFLQAKGKINKGLQETLRDAPHRFLAYNNGLCCTAATVEVAATRDGHARLRRAHDFQIVNGGQTTASIYHATKREGIDVSNVVVQMKLTVLARPEQVVEIVPLISRFANSQNKVNAADFSANDVFHRQLEVLSRTTWAPASSGLGRGSLWYYERARGSYLDDKTRAGTPAKRRRWEEENPLSQKFTKTDVAKVEQTWDQRPHRVSLGGEKNFTDWTLARQSAGIVEADVHFFQRLIAKALLFRAAERIVSAQGSGGIRANIVTYTLAWLSLETGQRIDLDRIWKSQSVGPLVSQAIEIVSKVAHQAIVSADRLNQNVTEWCKQEECWLRFRQTRIVIPDLTPELTALAQGPEASAGAARVGGGEALPERAKAQEMQAQIERLRIDLWPALEAWVRQTGELKPWQATFAGNFGRKLKGGRRPTTMECREALSLLQEAQGRGFPL
jgi:hypothetical protein